MKDYYAVLGANKNATVDEIKKAYRRLALKYHPDRNKGDKEAEERFKEINEAYAVLSDQEKKRQYDMFGAEGFRQRYSQEDIFQGFDIGDTLKDFGFGTSDIFSVLFGGGSGKGRGFRYTTYTGPSGQQTAGEGGPDFADYFSRGGAGPSQGRDMVADLTITLEEAAKGTEKLVSLQRKGKVEKIAVKIPPGIDTGKKLRAAGKGESGPGGRPSGDLYVRVNVQRHPLFHREGNDIYIDQEINFSEAALGTSIEVPTLNGIKKVKIPPGTSGNTKLRLKGEGIPHLKGKGKGDAYVRIVIRIPKKLTSKQKELVEGLSKEGL
ncbi:MAG: integrase [Deltaproteobacteria bacterium RBG_13_52_11]|nr:MAG: integrase [Deltaproteobacteria bacterium RBG_13_52_11]